MGKLPHIERLWAKVDKQGPDDCWPWTGGRDEAGYGVFYAGMRKHRAHRWLLGHLRGKPLIGGQTGVEDACHRCDNPPCCNPDHLYVGTRRRNVQDAMERRRMWQQQVTHCPQGHPYDEVNTYVKPGGARACRTCRRIDDKVRKAQIKAARTSCLKGHPLAGDNLLLWSKGIRRCRICEIARSVTTAERHRRNHADRFVNKLGRKNG